MTLTEALQKSPYVRRRMWPWSYYFYYDGTLQGQVWVGDSNNPRSNHLSHDIHFDNAIATDWEALEDIP
jgi:hypothetical protein